MRKIEKTKFHSWKIGELPEVCRQCVEGSKTVIFLTGLCSEHCYFCPISDTKKDRDVIFANEMPIKNIKDTLKEIKLCSSKGIGITGGDPLTKLDRCIKIIKLIKKELNNFHIHLYTPLNLVSEESLRRLSESGLDEIRFHPNLDNKSLWKRIKLGKKFPWKVGIEIPVISKKEKEIKDLIDFSKNYIDFLNLNELELSDTNVQSLNELEFIPKDDVSYAVKGSEELAFKILDYCKNLKFNVHYCAVKLKDKVQLAKRLKKRSKNIAKPFELVDEEGMITHGVIYLKDLSPGFSYLNKVKLANKEEKIKKLNEVIKKLKLKEYSLDENKLRILISIEIVQKLKDKIKSFNLIPAIVTEYPTFDSLEIEIDEL